MENVPRSQVFLAGQAVSMLGDGLALLAVPLLILQLSRSPLLAVLASLPGSAGYLAAGLPAGVMVDRLNPWHVIVAGDVIRAMIALTASSRPIIRVTAFGKLCAAAEATVKGSATGDDSSRLTGATKL